MAVLQALSVVDTLLVVAVLQVPLAEDTLVEVILQAPSVADTLVEAMEATDKIKYS